MSYQEPLSQDAIAISISKSPDMAVLGLADEHLYDAMAEVARHLLAMGARLIYGGDLRPGGFTELLFELVARHRRDADGDDERVGISNFFPWPVHVELSPDEVGQWREYWSGVAELVFLSVDGKVMSLDERLRLDPRPPTDEEWKLGLTSMRELVTAKSHARIVLGGKVDDFHGRMPGVAEEALVALRARQPLFLLGGFGGCARDIAEIIGLAPAWPATRMPWPGREDFTEFTVADLNNGLDAQSNFILAKTVHIQQAMTLILRGLLNRPRRPERR